MKREVGGGTSEDQHETGQHRRSESARTVGEGSETKGHVAHLPTYPPSRVQVNDIIDVLYLKSGPLRATSEGQTPSVRARDSDRHRRHHQAQTACLDARHQ